MNVALLLKFQSAPCCNLAIWRSDEHAKHRLFVRSIRSLFATTLPCSRWRVRNWVWNESTALDWQREINHHRTREVCIDIDIIFLVFLLSFLHVAARGSVFKAPRPVWDSFAELTQNGCRNFRLDFTSSLLVSPTFLLCSLASSLTAFCLSPSVNHSQPADSLLIRFHF